MTVWWPLDLTTENTEYAEYAEIGRTDIWGAQIDTTHWDDRMQELRRWGDLLIGKRGAIIREN